MTIYLYVKTHNDTGLKYLGKTSAKDPHAYPGSGKYWVSHLKKHGFTYKTEILRECETKEEVKEWGEYYSNLWDVVRSKEWANFRPETGDGGATRGMTGKKHTKATKIKISEKNKGHKHTDEAKKKIGAAAKNRTVSEETKEKHRNKVWSEKAIQNRLNNCLASAAKRKGTKNPEHRQKLFLAYVRKNEDLLKCIWQMFDSGMNRRQIALELKVSWERVDAAINRKEQIIKVLEN